MNSQFKEQHLYNANIQKNIQLIDVVIIGFGFSSIPLIRELEKDHLEYIIISDGESIWDKFEKNNRLDFDLVSSMHTSMYSFELVNQETKDRYLTSKEYQTFIKKYLNQYTKKHLKDWVTLVENYNSYSLVHTKTGKIFKTKHVIISTAFRRKMNTTLNEFDYKAAKNKTIVFTTMGDSANLMISNLIPCGNRIILITKGFLCLDKLFYYNNITYTLDQLEYHNIRHLSRFFYNKTILVGLKFIFNYPKISNYLAIDNLYAKYPLAIRNYNVEVDFIKMLSLSPIPNGFIAIKYWPIDSFQTLFDNKELKQSIEKGYLLNDIAYFIDQGLVELWPYEETTIDRENAVISWNNKTLKYDNIIDADHEEPNLPVIKVNCNDSPSYNYQYDCRNSFMGIIPKELKNIYLIGYIRPTTGGLNNITEMQCLFTHKIISDPAFHNEIYSDLEKKIMKYNERYYLSSTRKQTDHLVYYGFYTEDIARLMKINTRLVDCRSLRDIFIYFLFPNNAFKFRQEGAYKVEGVKELVQNIYDSHKGFAIIKNYLLTYFFIQFIAFTALIMIYYQQSIYFPPVIFLLFFIIILFNPLTAFISANTMGHGFLFNLILLLILATSFFYANPVIPIVSLVAILGLTLLFRKLKWARMPFNDLNIKRKNEYWDFFKKYCKTFKKVKGLDD